MDEHSKRSSTEGITFTCAKISKLAQLLNIVRKEGEGILSSKNLNTVPWSHGAECATSRQKDVQTRSNIVPHSIQQEEFYSLRSTNMPANEKKN
jgi:N-acetylmuramoyl-L-alanine amidase